MDAEAFQAFVQGQAANAAAMMEMVTVLKEKFAEEKGKTERFGEASKVVKFPDVFQPANSEEEISQWMDWKMTFTGWLCYAQAEYEKDLKDAEDAKDPLDFVEMTEDQHKRSEKLHSILVGLLRNRPLKILRSVEGRNGLEVWRELNRQFAPKTRARGIALLQAFLAHPNFNSEKTLVEQVLGLERLADEYAKVANEEISDSMKLSVLLKVVPQKLRQHLQLQLTDETDYATTKEKVISYERTTTSWSSQAVYQELKIKDKPANDDGPAAMDVDRVKGREKGKKGKGKSSTKDGKDGKGKGKWKSDGKSKSKDKGKYKSSGKAADGFGRGKGKGIAKDQCKLCGGFGHWGKECPVKSLRQVAEGSPASVATQSLVSSGSGAQATTIGGAQQQQTAVRRIELYLDEDEFMLDEPYVRMVTEETYDMTYSDSDDDWYVCGGGHRRGESNTGSIAKIVAEDAENPETHDAGGEVGDRGGNAYFEDFAAVVVDGAAVDGDQPDSGADMSVLPMNYGGVGIPLSRRSVLRDAQGNTMRGGALRQAIIVMEDDYGNQVHLRETFALSNVTEPLLALGKMIKKGWMVTGFNNEVKLSYGDFNKAVGFRNNSLVTKATVRTVNEEPYIPGKVKVRAVTMAFEGVMKNHMEVPGWHLSWDRKVPFLVVDSFPHSRGVTTPTGRRSSRRGRSGKLSRWHHVFRWKMRLRSATATQQPW